LKDRERELLILRTAWNTGCGYEWNSHTSVARGIGLSDSEITSVADGPGSSEWDPFDSSLLQAADELYTTSRVSDTVWSMLETRLSKRQLVEVLILVGNYTMIAYLVNCSQMGEERIALNGS
jgi:AhpD family alkylhydroperoxidase